MVDCVVIGAGPGGLGVAAELGRRGVRAVVLERGDGPAARWRGRYDRLRINTSSLTAFPPRGRFPLRYGRWPTRDQLVEHYERYARANALDLRPRTEVVRIEREGDAWLVRTRAAGAEPTAGSRPASGCAPGPGAAPAPAPASAAALSARSVVVATGKDGDPSIPAWPGRDRFGGPIVHAAAYRNARPFADGRMLVVGAGSSALDIAVDLLEGGAASVAVSIRTPPHLARRALAGLPADLAAVALAWLPRPAIDRIAAGVRRLSFGDLGAHGLPLPADPFTARVLERGMIPTIDPGEFVPAVKRGDIRVVGAVERLEPCAAILADGTREPADALVAATGYGRGLDPLVGHLGVLDERGHPTVTGPEHPPGAPGLHFIGFTDVLTGNLRQLRLDAPRVAEAITRRSGSVQLKGSVHVKRALRPAVHGSTSPRRIA